MQCTLFSSNCAIIVYIIVYIAQKKRIHWDDRNGNELRKIPIEYVYSPANAKLIMQFDDAARKSLVQLRESIIHLFQWGRCHLIAQDQLFDY